MEVGFWNALWTFMTMVILTFTALAALVQLRHLSSSNQIAALLAVQAEFRSARLQRALHYVEFELEARLDEAEFRDELVEIGFVDPLEHPEMDVCTWFNEIGTLVKNGLVQEDPFLEMFGRLVNRYWELLVPVVALLRRRRGPTQYENFEYLAARYRQWFARRPAGRYPKRTPRLKVVERWSEEKQKPTLV